MTYLTWKPASLRTAPLGFSTTTSIIVQSPFFKSIMNVMSHVTARYCWLVFYTDTTHPPHALHDAPHQIHTHAIRMRRPPTREFFTSTIF